MAWPLATDYNAVIQNPGACFSDPDLRQGQAASDLLGLPRPHSGNFADVYQVTGPGGQSWAVKCFTREVPGLGRRYSAISKHLRQTQRTFMVGFRYLKQGIRIGGQWYPVLKMHWVEGLRLNEFIAEHLNRPHLLEELAQKWLNLAEQLHYAWMAHGDLQHGNVLLVPGSKSSSLALRLIDYDGMFVPALAQKPPGEAGHPNYQHPQRLREGVYNSEVDRFAHLVIYTALRCLAVAGKSLWEKHDNQENLLFREADFRDPENSPLLRELWSLGSPEVRALVGQLVLACLGSLEQVPLLETLVSGSTVRPLSSAKQDHVKSVLKIRTPHGRQLRRAPVLVQSTGGSAGTAPDQTTEPAGCSLLVGPENESDEREWAENRSVGKRETKNLESGSDSSLPSASPPATPPALGGIMGAFLLGLLGGGFGLFWSGFAGSLVGGVAGCAVGAGIGLLMKRR